MGILTSFNSFSFSFSFRATVNGGASTSTQKEGRLFKSRNRVNYNYGSCYLCQKGLINGIMGFGRNGNLFDGLVCFSSNGGGVGGNGDDGNGSGSATKEKVVVEEIEKSGTELGEKNDELSSFSSSSSSGVVELGPGRQCIWVEVYVSKMFG